jgi:hypothetical protein
MLSKSFSFQFVKRKFSHTSSAYARKAPKEEFNNNMFATRKRTADPFDRQIYKSFDIKMIDN